MLPPDWEVASYGKSPEKGTIRFQTREGLQAMLSWRKLPEAPDVARMMAEVHRRALEARARDASSGLASEALRVLERGAGKPGQAAREEARRAEAARRAASGFSRLHTERAGAFTVGYREAGEPAQASLYLPETGMILEWLFPQDRPESRRGPWRTMLQSYRPNTGPERRWALFGLGASLPAGFRLTDVAAYPANTVLQFDGPGRLGVNLRRWGLPAHVKEGLGLVDGYRQIVRRLRNRVLDAEETAVPAPGGRTWPAARVRYERQGEVLMDKLAGHWWQGEGLCWENADEKRLYSFEQLGPAKTRRLAWTEVFAGRPGDEKWQ